MKKSAIFILILILLTACGETPVEMSESSETLTILTSIPAPSLMGFQAWQDAYAEFLRENISTSEIDFDAFVDDSDEDARFGAFKAGGYPVAPFFYLYDIDSNGTPEMIYIDAAKGYEGDVYAYKNDSISKIGNIEFYPFGGFYILNDKTEGLYSDVGYKGHYGEIYFYSMDSDVLTIQTVIEYNNQPELSPSQPELPYTFDNFTQLDYYEITEANITEVIYGR